MVSHRHISPLAPECESFTLSSSITLFIQVWRQPTPSEPFSHVWLVSWLQCDTVMRTALAVMRREKQKAAFGLKTTYYSDDQINKLWCELLLVGILMFLLLDQTGGVTWRRWSEELRLLRVRSMFLCHQNWAFFSFWVTSCKTDEAHTVACFPQANMLFVSTFQNICVTANGHLLHKVSHTVYHSSKSNSSHSFFISDVLTFGINMFWLNMSTSLRSVNQQHSMNVFIPLTIFHIQHTDNWNKLQYPLGGHAVMISEC